MEEEEEEDRKVLKKICEKRREVCRQVSRYGSLGEGDMK